MVRNVSATASIPHEAGAGRGRLDSEKARRIVEAMRASVGTRGAAGSTFDQVASEAGVSRGLLHYYFGTKERLLVEVVRHDCDVRMTAIEASLSTAASADAILRILVEALEDLVERDPGAFALIFEMFTASRQNDELGEAMAEVYTRVRDQIAQVLRAKRDEGVVELRGEPESVASILIAMGDGLALQILSDPEWDSSSTFEAGIAAAGFLLGA
jgi:AcrR family transcriptional regulator